MGAQYKFYGIATKAEDGSADVQVIASTASVDRHGDIVDQVWQLDSYRTNPVILWAHDPNTPPVGRAVSVEVQQTENGPALLASIKFDDGEHNPLGRTVAEQFRNGMLSAVSVGFRPGSAVPRSSLDENDPRHAKTGLILSNNELLEISAVPIPANSDALAQRGVERVESEDERIVRILSGLLPDMVPGAVLEVVRNDPKVSAAIKGLVLSEPTAEPDPWAAWRK